MKRFTLSILVLMLIGSCASMKIIGDYNNPEQDAKLNNNSYSKVLLFNKTNPIAYPMASSIGIEIIIDSMQAPRLFKKQYIELFIKKGKHILTLTHWDVFKFTNNYKIDFEKDSYILELNCSPVGTPYKIINELPKDFYKKYTNRIQEEEIKEKS
jgi:hypothetical protein